MYQITQLSYRWCCCVSYHAGQLIVLFSLQLSGPLQVIHKVKARVDCKGGKNDLSIKQGEPIEILRITDNPEGRWLARTQDGSCE